MFSTVSPEQRVPKDHPLRAIRTIADEALKTLAPTFRQIATGPYILDMPANYDNNHAYPLAIVWHGVRKTSQHEAAAPRPSVAAPDYESAVLRAAAPKFCQSLPRSTSTTSAR